MDPNDPIIQAIRQINELSGALLDSLLGGGGGEGGAPAPAPEEAPAGPPQG